MPNRIIKESANESQGLSQCSIFACDLFKRLITYADDNGRFNADTQIMLARLYPREMDCVTEDDIVAALVELAGVGKIAFYTSSPRKDVYGCFPRWNEHQRVRDSKSKCPDPDDTTVNDWYLQRFIPIDLKIEIIERDGFKCRLCGKFITTDKDAKRLIKHGEGMYHIDHIVPVLQGGRATRENLRLTCRHCNLSRKKKFSFSEIVGFSYGVEPIGGELRQVAANCGELPQAAASCSLIQSNPIQSESESESNTREFDAFWDAYPRKVGKDAARRAFAKRRPSAELVQKMITAVEDQKQSAQWIKDGGQFIPNPATWLNQGRWDDEPVQGKTTFTNHGRQRRYSDSELAHIGINLDE